MKHHKRQGGFSSIRKPPSRKLRKAIENFLRLFSCCNRAQAREAARDKIYAHAGEHPLKRKGRQNTIRIGTAAREDMLPDILAEDYVIGHFCRGHFKTRLTVAKHL